MMSVLVAAATPYVGLERLRQAIQSQLGRKMMTTSTLVETVSINYEDFNESFLTCGTCLCTYDGQEHAPKLLPCSHTVCRICLERIATGTGVRDAGSFRCPICRETIPLPRGGVGALPPSFLVNQLLDLMSRQRREVVPKCSNHPSQELLFCETCDCVFCSICTGGSHGIGNGSCEHTVIPFSIAIKRMSEILLYKANLCIDKLNKAADNVNEEMRKLDQNADHTFETINRSFQEIVNMVDKRRQEVLGSIKKIKEDKKSVLQEQLGIIDAEKGKVEQECNGLQYQVEVRNITKKIGDLNEKIDSVGNIMEPRENAFVKYDCSQNRAFERIAEALADFGNVRTSTTFPPLSTARVPDGSAHLETFALLQAVDYRGTNQKVGGDPVAAELRRENGDTVAIEIIDKDDGTYEIRFLPEHPGLYKLAVSIFNRPVKDSPFHFSVSEHIDPTRCFGSRGHGDSHFLQPVGVAISSNGNVFVLDTGNSRIKVLSENLTFLEHLAGKGLEDRGGIGICATPCDTLLVINWRTKLVTELTLEGNLVNQFSHPDFVEPIGIATNSKGEILVADNGAGALFVFDSTGKPARKIGKKGNAPGQFNLPICCLGTGPQDEVLVADSRIQVLSPAGEFVREIYPEGRNKGRFGGLAYDGKGNLLATQSDKSFSYIQVFDFSSGRLNFCVDSWDAKMKRPNGLAVTSDYNVVAVDLGNDCVKKFRYR